MAVTRTPKKLAQTALNTSSTAVYTTPASTKTQVTEIYLANTNTTTARTVTLYAHGTADANRIVVAYEIAAKGTVILEDKKILLSATEVLAAKQDTGTDVILTAYGVEEVTT